MALSGNVDPTTNIVMSGPYEGEMMALCDSGDTAAKIPGVSFTKEEAVKIRERCDLNVSQFHLSSRGREGEYCFHYKNPAIVRYCMENFKCSDLGESDFGHYWRHYVRKMPVVKEHVNSTRCEEVKKFFNDYVREEPGALSKLWDGLWIGAGFAASAMVLNKAMQIATGVSIIERIVNRRNGGPKNPPGGASAGRDDPQQVATKPLPPPMATRDMTFDPAAQTAFAVLLGAALMAILAPQLALMPKTAFSPASAMFVNPHTRPEGRGFLGVGVNQQGIISDSQSTYHNNEI